MTIQRGWVYLSDLNPQMGTEPGKIRPVLVLQTDLLNNTHPSTIVLPLTTRIQKQAKRLRVHLAKGEAGLDEPSDILVDQIRTIDNRRFIKALGMLPQKMLDQVIENLAIVLDITASPS